MMPLLTAKNKSLTCLFAIITILSILTFAGCRSTKSSIKVIGSWIDKEKLAGRKGNGVFIIVITQNMNNRMTMENDLAAAAKASGIRAVRSLDVFTPVTGVPDSVVIAAMMRAIDKSDCSSILTVSLVDVKSKTKYVPSSSYTYDPYTAYPYYGSFGSYYSFMIGSTYTPGYYVTDNTYYIESNLYDEPTQKLLFAIQTNAQNPPEIEKASKKFTQTLIDELKSNDLLKKD
jgi:hypothetical protein